jgi:hypothetical protein
VVLDCKYIEGLRENGKEERFLRLRIGDDWEELRKDRNVRAGRRWERDRKIEVSSQSNNGLKGIVGGYRYGKEGRWKKLKENESNEI